MFSELLVLLDFIIEIIECLQWGHSLYPYLFIYKSEHFKTNKLNFWDRNAPYPNSVESKISWNEAKHIVLDSYYDFDEIAGKIAQKFFLAFLLKLLLVGGHNQYQSVY